MTNGWPMVPIGQVMSKSDDWIPIQPESTYREVTVKLWGKGVTLRRECLGAEIKSNRRLRVHRGQFILSRIDARNGAFGLIPNELDGAVVSSDFPVLVPNKDRLLNPFLYWLAKMPGFIELCRAASEGTTNRVRLKEDRFLAMPIPLPPIEEQRRLVARIEALAAKIAEAQSNASRTRAEAVTLVGAQAARVFNDLSLNFPARTLGSFDAEVTSGPRNWSQYISDSGLRFYRAQDLTASFTIDAGSKCFIDPPRTSSRRGWRRATSRFSTDGRPSLCGRTGSFPMPLGRRLSLKTWAAPMTCGWGKSRMMKAFTA